MGHKITVSFELDSEKDAHTVLQLHEFKKAFNVIRRIHLEIFKQNRNAFGAFVLEEHFWAILREEKLNHDALPDFTDEQK